MKVTFNTEELKSRLTQLGSVVAKKATLEVYEYIRLYTQEAQVADAAGNSQNVLQVKMTALDIDATLTVRYIKATADGPVDILIPFSKFNQTMQNRNVETTVIDVNGEVNAVVTNGKLKFPVPGYPLEKFPAFLESPTTIIGRIALPGLKSQIENVIYAVPAAAGKFSSNVAKLESKDGSVRLVGSDGFRLVLNSVKQDVAPLDLTLPKTALEKIGKLEGGGEQNVLQIGEVEAGFWFYTDTETLTVNRTAGQFPPYQRLLPKEGDFVTTITVASPKALLASIASLLPWVDKDKQELLFRTTSENAAEMEMEAVNLTVRESDSQAFKFDGIDAVEVVATGPATKFSVDVNLLQDFLSRVADYPVIINVKSADQLLDFRGAEGSIQYLQRPTALANQTK